MNALLLIYILIGVAVLSFISGILILFGLGWALIAFGVCLIGFVAFLSRGLIDNEK